MHRRKRDKSEVAEGETQLIHFRLGEESFGVHVDQVREIVKVGDITRVPRMPVFIEGIMNLRGRLTTIIDLRRRLAIDLDGGRGPHARIIVAEIGDNQVGIIVDSVKDVIRIAPDSISPPPEAVSSKLEGNFLSGICRLKDNLVMLMDLDRLLSGEELDGLKGLEETVET